MTEAEWEAATDPTPMLEFLRGRMSTRKLRLLNCGIVRSVPFGLGGETMWELVANRPWFSQKTWKYELSSNGDVIQTQELITLSLHESVEIVEQAADTPGLEAVLASAAFATFAARYEAEGEMLGNEANPGFTPASVYYYRLTQCFEGLPQPASEITGWIVPDADEFRMPISPECNPSICSLTKDVFSLLPFRPVTIPPSWLTSNVVALAAGIYDEKAFDRMPILADALQDAGCNNDDVLNHCRGDGPHVRGCWVIDLLLSKS